VFLFSTGGLKEQFHHTRSFTSSMREFFKLSGPLDRPSEIDGSALEGLVAQHLVAWCDYTGSDNHVYFWRTTAGTEVDFVLYGNQVFLAIEVKNSGRVDRSDLKSLKAFQDDYPEVTPYLLYRGKEKLKIDNILCLPCSEFLMGLRPGKIIL
jgi:predicted AAA+ superfamily ATPase